MNKVVYVKAKFKPLGKMVTVDVPTGEKRKGLFGGEKDVLKTEKRWEQTGVSDSAIDGEQLAKDAAEAVAALNQEGYEVVSLTNVNSGHYNYETRIGSHGVGEAWAYGYGFGYSYTEGVVIVARKMGRHGDERGVGRDAHVT